MSFRRAPALAGLQTLGMRVRPEGTAVPELMVLFLFFFTDSLEAAKASKLVSAEPVMLQAAEIHSLCST